VLQGKLIIEARFTSAGMYGQLQRGQMNMRKRVQNKRLLGIVSSLSVNPPGNHATLIAQG
jgi:hypothetical protein